MEILNTYPVKETKPQKIDTVDGIDLYRIPGYDNYGISKCGKVYSFERRVAVRGGGTRKVPAKWLKCGVSPQGYRQVTISNESGRLGTPLHRLLGLVFLGLGEDQTIDHIDGCRLNNSLRNLRLATPSQNQANIGLRKDNRSGYKGVSWSKRSKKWQGYIHANGRSFHLGFYSDKEQAAKVRDAAALKLHGEFAQLNFPVSRA